MRTVNFTYISPPIRTGNGYHWKGLYVESMQKSICRGLKSKVKDFPDVSFLILSSFLTSSLPKRILTC